MNIKEKNIDAGIGQNFIVVCCYTISMGELSRPGRTFAKNWAVAPYLACGSNRLKRWIGLTMIIAG
jgi:hypothetical protein